MAEQAFKFQKAGTMENDLHRKVMQTIMGHQRLMMRDVERLLGNPREAEHENPVDNSDCDYELYRTSFSQIPMSDPAHDPTQSDTSNVYVRHRNQRISSVKAEDRKAAFSEASEYISGIEEFVDERSVNIRSSTRAAIKQLSEMTQGPPRDGFVKRCAYSRAFEFFILGVILCQTFYAIWEANYQISHLEDRLHNSAFVELVFLTVYSAEILLKLGVHRLDFFCNNDKAWNIFDFLLLLLSVFDLVLSSDTQTSPQILRVLRIIRISRVLRVVRLLYYFSALRLMLNCVVGSLDALLWSCLLILGFSMIFAIALVQQITSYLKINRGVIPTTQQTALLDHFGSVGVTLFTLYKSITGGVNWGEIYTLAATAGRFSGGLFALYILLVWLSVSNIVTSMFIDKAMQLAKPDIDEVMLDKSREELLMAKELNKVFDCIDTNHTHLISLEELQVGLKNWRLKSFFDVNNLRISDAEMFFQLLATMSKGAVDKTTFVSGCLKMKGYASSIDVLALQHQVLLLEQGLRDLICKCHYSIDRLREQMKTSQQTPVQHNAAAETAQFHVDACYDDTGISDTFAAAAGNWNL